MTKKIGALMKPKHSSVPHKQTVVHSTTKPAFYGQHWKSKADGGWYGHVKGMNHAVVFPSQKYKSAASFAKLMKRCGWETKLITDPNWKLGPSGEAQTKC